MRKLASLAKTALLIIAIAIPFTFLSSQEDARISKLEKVGMLTNLFYTVDGFQERLTHKLENHPVFEENVSNTVFVNELSEIFRKTALTTYSAVIEDALMNEFSEAEIDSLLTIMESNSRELIYRVFQLDNKQVDRKMETYLNGALSEVTQMLRTKDSLLFWQEYPEDLSNKMDGVYEDEWQGGALISISGNGTEQLRTLQGEEWLFRLVWLSNSKYAMLPPADAPYYVYAEAGVFNIYEIEEDKYKYIFVRPDGSFTKSILTEERELSYKEEVTDFQEELNESYGNPDTSPLSADQQVTFKTIGGHPFFATDQQYQIEADFEVYETPAQVKIPTSNARVASYNLYGKATFVLGGQNFELLVYQSQRLMRMPQYRNHLFLPFTDLTSGEETYGGGRYIDLRIPEDKTKIIIDFNKAYQPYCAYSAGYSCPIPPAENFIEAKIEAGVKHVELE